MRISDWSSDVCSSDLAGERIVHRSTKRLDDGEIGQLGPAADVEAFAERIAFQHQRVAQAMILHMQPVADLPSVAIDRLRLARRRVQRSEERRVGNEWVSTGSPRVWRNP